MGVYLAQASKKYDVEFSRECGDAHPPCLKFYYRGELVFEISLTELLQIIATVLSFIPHSETKENKTQSVNDKQGV